MRFISTRGQCPQVSFEEAVLQGYAPDGGLYVPERIPTLTPEQLAHLATLSFCELAVEILSLFIEAHEIPRDDLVALVHKSYASFRSEQVTPSVLVGDYWMVELYHGPTLAFKDIAMGLLLNLVHYFLARKQQRVNVLVATSGDTGPACAHGCHGLGDAITCWILYPQGRISHEQELQMIALGYDNVRIVRVDHSTSDDLDVVVQRLDSDAEFKRANRLTSVNSINVARVLAQTVHFFYAYYHAMPAAAASSSSHKTAVVVPTGACGNLMGGTIARRMGLPIDYLVVATNSNDICHQLFSTGTMRRRETVLQTPSNAMDIVVPYNLWRLLYYAADQDAQLLSQWMDDFAATGSLTLPELYRQRLTTGTLSGALDNASTLAIIRSYYERHSYLLDPHGAVAVGVAEHLQQRHSESESSTDTTALPRDARVLCMLTAHAAKFPAVIAEALQLSADAAELPDQARHPNLQVLRSKTPVFTAVPLEQCEAFLRSAIA